MLIKEYIITSPKSLEVSVFAGYNAGTGVLVTLKFDGLSAKAIHKFGAQMPCTEQHLEKLAKEYGWKVKPLEMDLSFENFYEEYGNKVGKKRGEARWKRMKKEDRVKALLYIEKYKNLLKLRPGQQMLYPESYMNAEPWND